MKMITFEDLVAAIGKHFGQEVRDKFLQLHRKAVRIPELRFTSRADPGTLDLKKLKW